MIMQQIANGIRRQDWFTVFIEIMIVVIGVYVGIYIGETAKERAMTIEVNKKLSALQVQLREDLVNLDSILEVHTLGIERYQQAIDLLSASPVDQEALQELVTITEADTFFPNRSAYQTIRDLGFLAEVKDAELQLLVANLFERAYVRQEVNADFFSQMTVDYHTLVRDVYWDRIGKKFINDRPESTIRMRNGIRNVMGQSLYYRGVLRRAVKPELVKTIDVLDAYLKER